MALVLSSEVPADGLFVVQRALERLQPGGAEAKALVSVRDHAPEKLCLSAPHGVYRLARNPSEVDCLGGATRWAWRYLLLEGTTVLGAADVLPGSSPKGSPFAGFHFGPFPRAMADAIRDAESSGRGGDYEVRMLSVPEAYLMALWLKALSEHTADLVLPLAPLGVPTMVARRAYSREEFCALLKMELSRRSTRASDTDAD